MEGLSLSLGSVLGSALVLKDLLWSSSIRQEQQARAPLPRWRVHQDRRTSWLYPLPQGGNRVGFNEENTKFLDAGGSPPSDAVPCPCPPALTTQAGGRQPAALRGPGEASWEHRGPQQLSLIPGPDAHAALLNSFFLAA